MSQKNAPTRIQPTAKTAKVEKPAKAPKEKKEKKVRSAFDPKLAVDSGGVKIPLTEDGKMQGVPANWSASNLPLKRDAFAGDHFFLRFKADRIEARIAKTLDTIKEMRAEADRVEKFGDAETRKLVRKLQKSREAYRKLFSSLKEELGDDVDLDELLGGEDLDDVEEGTGTEE